MSDEESPVIEPLRIFKNRSFVAFARRQRIADATLCRAIDEIRRGLVDADLGGGVIKKRLARPGGGKSGGFRSILAFQAEQHTFFVYGFAKNERDNITDKELSALRLLAKSLLGLSPEELEATIEEGELSEVFCNEEENLQQ